MKKITRKEALSLGLKRYYTGKPCSNGHVSERFVSGYSCVDCSKQSALRWQKENKNKVAVIAKRYRDNNPDAVKARYENWYENNKDYFVNWRDENREKVNEAACKYRRNNMDKVLATNRNRRARIAGSDGTHCKGDIQKILTLQKHKCANCFKPIKGGFHVDHIMPLSLGGSNSPENLQCLCPTCNVRKGATHPIEWANKNGRII